MSEFTTRRAVLAGVCGLALVATSACGRKKEEPVAPEPMVTEPEGPPEGSLEWAVAGAWRPASDKERDVWRHPVETLRFLGLQPRMTVVEFWPGSGWYTQILAPYLAKGGGTLHLVGFPEGDNSDPAQLALNRALRDVLEADRKLYGTVQFSEFGAATGPVAPPGTADMVLFMRQVHAWMAAGIAEKAFADAFMALRPGGILGVEQHRLGPEQDQDPAAANGYVQEAFIRQLAEEAGFTFVEGSEINANPADTKDHPFGVETLPPRRLTAPVGEMPNPDFDSSPYDAIGESDRMTLKFRKPE